MLGSARFVRRRASGHAGVLLTASLTALVTAVLLVSATVLAPEVAQNALNRTLADTDATMTASTGFDERWPELDQSVRTAVSDAGPIESITATISTTAFTMPDAEENTRLALGYVEDAESRAHLTTGRWPDDDAQHVETAVHAAALDALGLQPGDVMTLHPLTGSRTPVEVTVVGGYEPQDAVDPVWHGHGTGIRPAPGDGFTVIGPLLFQRDDMVNRIAPATATTQWLLPLAAGEVTLDDADAVTAALRALAGDLSDLRAGDFGQQMAVDGEVAALVERAGAAASSTRAILLVVVAMLTVLGIWALAFTARLVAAGRAAGTALLRARGVREGRLLRWSFLGAALPAVGVAAVAPLVADVLLDGSALTAPAWLASIAVGVLWLLLMVSADLRAGRSVASVATAAARPRRAAAQRAGLDLVLLGLGILGLQQLRRPPEESPEVVLVVAPALVVLAGSVVLARALPWIARAAAALGSAGAGIAAMLGTQETARRTARHLAAGVLVVLAITVSVFSATTQATWDAFRADTVALTEPADVRLTPAATTDDDLGTRLQDLPGVEAAMAVVRTSFRDDGTPVDVVGVDPATAATVMRWDADLAGGDPAQRLDLLSGASSPGSLTALVTDDLADRFGLAEGDDIDLPLSAGTRVGVHVAAVVTAVPGTTHPAAILTDAESLSALGAAASSEWWLATSDDGQDAAAAAIDLPGVNAAATHADALDQARQDPSSAGIGTGLTAGLAFAAVFVLIGVVVHTVTSFQSRSTEYALLRAIGLGRRSATGSVTVEHAVLLGFATLTGLGLGLVVAWLVVPHAVGGLAGLPEVPPLRLSVPWGTIAVLTGAVVALAAILIAVQAILTRRLDVAAVLREGG